MHRVVIITHHVYQNMLMNDNHKHVLINMTCYNNNTMYSGTTDMYT